MFSFPLVLGAVRLGSLDCYRDKPGDLGRDQLGDGLTLADAAFAVVLAEAAGHEPDDLDWISDIHAEVHQACGIVMYDLKITIDMALLRIRAYAYAHDLPISEEARQIVDRRLSLNGER